MRPGWVSASSSLLSRLAIPKSATFARSPSGEIRMFDGDVAMEDAAIVGCRQRRRDLSRIHDGTSGFERTASAQQRRQRSAADELHHDRRPFVDEDVVDRNDVRVDERGGGARLDEQPFPRRAVQIDPGRERFDGDVALQQRIVGARDGRHPARSEHAADAISGCFARRRSRFHPARCSHVTPGCSHRPEPSAQRKAIEDVIGASVRIEVRREQRQRASVDAACGRIDRRESTAPCVAREGHMRFYVRIEGKAERRKRRPNRLNAVREAGDRIRRAGPDDMHAGADGERPDAVDRDREPVAAPGCRADAFGNPFDQGRCDVAEECHGQVIVSGGVQRAATPRSRSCAAARAQAARVSARRSTATNSRTVTADEPRRPAPLSTHRAAAAARDSRSRANSMRRRGACMRQPLPGSSAECLGECAKCRKGTRGERANPNAKGVCVPDYIAIPLFLVVMSAGLVALIYWGGFVEEKRNGRTN
nr:hypothetical protein [Vulcanimicrobium alpinum]